MIYTVTFNPAIDCVMQVRDLELGHVNRAITQEFYFGGKGVNVSYVLRNLGRTSTAWGFIAGWTGAALEAALQEDGIPTGFVHLPQGNTRVNAKLKGTYVDIEGDMETAVNAGGAPIDDDSLQQFFDKLEAVQPGDFVILSGGVPKGTPKDIYARIMAKLDGRGAKIVVDATEQVLMQSLPYKPFLVKPNDEELAEIWRAPEIFPCSVCIPIISEAAILGVLWFFANKTHKIGARETEILDLVARRVVDELERKEVVFARKAPRKTNARDVEDEELKKWIDDVLGAND